jgi:hypothetical protein
LFAIFKPFHLPSGEKIGMPLEEGDNAAEETVFDETPSKPAQDHYIDHMRRDYEARLLQANLRTEAVRAGMIDLDGLKLVDPTSVKVDNEGNIIDGKALMATLRKQKPWLFGAMSSSGTTPTPSSAPVKQKMAIDMNEEEYAAARAAIVKYSY